MANSEPLARLLAKYVTPDVLAAIAREYAKGRALQIATTDLDSGRPVTWDMGRIASSNTPGALELFRKIIVASTSIPGVVSPVMIDVEVDGKPFQEMHRAIRHDLHAEPVRIWVSAQRQWSRMAWYAT